MRKRTPLLILTCSLAFLSCMSMHKDREVYLLDGIDISQTLLIAEYELQRNETGSSLTLWALRDQDFTIEEAKTVEALYFTYIDGMPSDFDTWHYTWAVTSIYRQNNSEVQTVLLKAFEDASMRAAELNKTADTLANSEEIYRGDVHALGRGFAKSHLVVPGNKKYLQSADEYFDKLKK